MVSRPSRVSWAVLSLIFLASACEKSTSKFNLSHPHKERQLIVTVAAGTDLQQLRNLRGEPRVEKLAGDSLLITFPRDVDLESKAEEIAQAQGVRSVEANLIYKLEERVPNDPDFAKLFGLQNLGQNNGTAGADIGATRAWDSTTGSDSVVVGIIDSGVDYNHPDLKDNIYLNPGESGLDAEGVDKSSNGVDDDNNGFVDDFHGWDFSSDDNNPMDDHSHGTHVAGTIGAKGDNGIGVVGVNWSVKMVPIKVFSASGDTSTDILIRGIDYATKLGGITATNNSWGGGAFSDAMVAAIQRHADAGIIFVAAAGNESNNNDVTPSYPATYDLPNIISVAATNRRDELSSFSNYGARTVTIAAPGEDIWSTVPNGSYGAKSGTSMATPQVTGAIALLKSQFPALDVAGLKQKILSSTTKVARLANSVRFGRLDVASALENDSVAPARVVGLEVEEQGLNEITVSFAETGDDGEEGKAALYQIRLSAAPISSEAEWEAADVVTLVDAVTAEGRVAGRITGLPFNRSGFLTVRAFDNVSNASELSESLVFELKPVTILFSEDNNDVSAWTVDKTWGTLTEGETAFLSDSPLGSYANSLNASATSKDLDFGTNDLVLGLTMRYDFENNYDFGFIEISEDGGTTWKEVVKLSGTSPLESRSISLKKVLTANAFRLRFRTQSDFSITKKGWDIDQVQIIGQQQR